MLQQVLKDMYIDPDLLAELDEESKQILFFKMREEQVRRWKEREEKLEKEERKKSQKPKLKKAGKKAVSFLKAADGNPWVWVMGEHENDLTVEQILEKEAKEKAELEALKEMEEYERKEQEKLDRMLQEEKEKVEAEQRAKEEELRRQAKEAEKISNKKALQQIEMKKKEEEELTKKKIREVQRKIDRIKRSSISSIYEEKERRSSQIFLSLKERKENLMKTAEQNQPKLEEAWREQEKKAKEVDAERRALARKAREEHQQSIALKPEDNIISSLMNFCDSNHEKQQKPKAKTRPPKPPNRLAVIKWFQEEEEPRGAGLDPNTKLVAEWFHGIIGRQEAEDMLEDKKPGTFLVRVSEKIYGYAVSLRSQYTSKHFLIVVSPAGYKFIGKNQILHPSLASLIKFYQDKPISAVGQEKLQYPCGQCRVPPDTEELFAENKVESSYL